MVFRHVLSYFLLGLSVCFPAQVAAESLHVAVASNFKQTHLALVAAFLKVYSKPDRIKILTSSGSSGTLFAQISHGAPFDVYLSADALRPDRLIELGLASENSRLVYAQGQVALWRPDADHQVSISELEGTLKDGSISYVIANPDLAPYGEAAKMLMSNHGIWKSQDASRITAHNIATAFQYLASGTVSIGWVAMSQLRTWQKKHPVAEHSYWLADVSEYLPIQQVGVILSRSENKILAATFLSFLTAPDAKTLIKSYGYLLPK